MVATSTKGLIMNANQFQITRFDLRTINNHDFGPKYKRDYVQMAKRKTAKVFVWPVGESIIDNVMNRRDRPADLYREVVAKRVADELVANGCIDSTDKVKLHWSQKAGCSCGCSPGFVVKGCNLGADVYIDIAPKAE